MLECTARINLKVSSAARDPLIADGIGFKLELA